MSGCRGDRPVAPTVTRIGGRSTLRQALRQAQDRLRVSGAGVLRVRGMGGLCASRWLVGRRGRGGGGALPTMRGPISCIPMGRPFESNPQGREKGGESGDAGDGGDPEQQFQVVDPFTANVDQLTFLGDGDGGGQAGGGDDDIHFLEGVGNFLAKYRGPFSGRPSIPSWCRNRRVPGIP